MIQTVEDYGRVAVTDVKKNARVEHPAHNRNSVNGSWYSCTEHLQNICYILGTVLGFMDTDMKNTFGNPQV